MPQMAPLLWLNLLILFIIIYIIFVILNYYIFTPTKLASDSMTELVKTTEKSWKW